jgi:hypothetical protein
MIELEKQGHFYVLDRSPCQEEMVEITHDAPYVMDVVSLRLKPTDIHPSITHLALFVDETEHMRWDVEQLKAATPQGDWVELLAPDRIPFQESPYLDVAIVATFVPTDVAVDLEAFRYPTVLVGFAT